MFRVLPSDLLEVEVRDKFSVARPSVSHFLGRVRCPITPFLQELGQRWVWSPKSIKIVLSCHFILLAQIFSSQLCIFKSVFDLIIIFSRQRYYMYYHVVMCV